MTEKYIRDVYVYENYFWDFYYSQSKEVQDKIDFVIGIVRSMRVIPERFFKHIEGTKALYEMRVKVGSNIYRFFCFFDEDNVVILLNGIQKKSDKTPRQEIKKSERLRQKYYEDKTKS